MASKMATNKATNVQYSITTQRRALFLIVVNILVNIVLNTVLNVDFMVDFFYDDWIAQKTFTIMFTMLQAMLTAEKINKNYQEFYCVTWNETTFENTVESF